MIEALRAKTEDARSKYARDESDYPHFASSKSKRFPFKHIELWADSEYQSLEDYVNSLESIVSNLERARIPEIRNGVQHYRDKDKFPSTENLRNCIELTISSFDEADSLNFLPKEFWVTKRSVDEFGISKWTLEDYNKRSVDLTLPHTLTGLLHPDFATAYAVAYGSVFGPSVPGPNTEP